MYNPLAGSSYIKLPKDLDNPRKGLINIQNTYHNKCFKSYLIRYLNHANHHPARITKADKDFAKIFDLKDRKFPKLEIFTEWKQIITSALVFWLLK